MPPAFQQLHHLKWEYFHEEGKSHKKSKLINQCHLQVNGIYTPVAQATYIKTFGNLQVQWDTSTDENMPLSVCLLFISTAEARCLIGFENKYTLFPLCPLRLSSLNGVFWKMWFLEFPLLLEEEAGRSAYLCSSIMRSCTLNIMQHMQGDKVTSQSAWLHEG